MTHRIAVIGAYGSGKTTLSSALAELTGLPRTHGSPMLEPIGGKGIRVHDWSPGQLLQQAVNRYTERVLGESRCPDGFISDGSALHEWVYAKVRLVAGSYPATDAPLSHRHRASEIAVLEAVVDELGLLMRHHAAHAYDTLLYVPVEFELAPDNRPINEHFRRICDEVLLAALEHDGRTWHPLHGSLADRLEQAAALLGTSTGTDTDTAAEHVRRHSTEKERTS